MLPQMTGRQRYRANALIKKLCANYDDGNCLLLDEGEGCVCVQSISYSLLCRYFRSAVLPADPALEAEILGTHPDRCVSCGAPIIKRGNRKKYCEKCADIAYKRQQAEYGRFEVKKEGKGINTLPLKVRGLKSRLNQGLFTLYFSILCAFSLRTPPAVFCMRYRRISHNTFFQFPRLIMRAPQETHLSGCVPSISASNAGSAGSTALRKYLHKSE